MEKGAGSMKYAVKYLNEVFSEDFVDYVNTTLHGEPADAKILTMIMKEIQSYETKRNLEFVSFFGSDMIIFKAA